jgi:anti-sigma factor RsiW
MKCPSENRENAEILLAYSSRTLNGSDTERLERHLCDCQACREFVRAQRAVWEALDSWEAEPVSEDFDRRLFQRIEREVSWWQRMRSHMSLLLGYRALSIAAVAALLVMAVWLDRPSPSRAPAQAIVHVEALQPDQVVEGLDEMEVLDQFNHLMKPDSSTTKM